MIKRIKPRTIEEMTPWWYRIIRLRIWGILEIIDGLLTFFLGNRFKRKGLVLEFAFWEMQYWKDRNWWK